MDQLASHTTTSYNDGEDIDLHWITHHVLYLHGSGKLDLKKQETINQKAGTYGLSQRDGYNKLHSMDTLDHMDQNTLDLIASVHTLDR